MGHAATKPDKVNIGITKDFKDQKFLISQLYHNVIYLLFLLRIISRQK